MARVMAALVFDLDGTLIDSAPDIQKIANGILTEEGHAPIDLVQTRSFVGMGAAVFVARMRAARAIAARDQARLLAKFKARYLDAVTLTTPYPAAPETLAALRQAGHRIGICTNKPQAPARAVLTHLGLMPQIEVLIGGDSLPVHKPDPQPLQAAFEALGDGAGVFIGDSEVDAETARRAQRPFLLFTEGYRQTPATDLPHDAAFADYTALPAVIADLFG